MTGTPGPSGSPMAVVPWCGGLPIRYKSDTTMGGDRLDQRRKRRPLVAAALSLVTVGLGQIYNAQPRKAAAFLSACGLLLATALAFDRAAVTSFTALAVQWSVAAVIVVVILLSIGDAFIAARRRGEITLRAYNRWYVYLAVAVAVSAAVQTVLELRETYGLYHMPGGSMLPTLDVGERFVAAKGAYRDRLPRRGEVVMFEMPDGVYVKRVIGLPGDRVSLRDGALYINDAPVPRRLVGTEVPVPGSAMQARRYEEALPGGAAYEILVSNPASPLNNTPVYDVPDGQLFVLGDNRDRSADSRMPGVGFVPVSAVVEKPTYVYWSADRGRIGLALR